MAAPTTDQYAEYSYMGLVSQKDREGQGPTTLASIAYEDGNALTTLGLGTSDGEYAKWSMSGIRSNPEHNSKGATEAAALAAADGANLVIAESTAPSGDIPYFPTAIHAIRSNPCFSRNSSADIVALAVQYASFISP